MPTEHLTIEVSVDFPDLKPEDVDALNEAIESAEGWFQAEQVERLTDLRDRITRMLLTACEKDQP